MRTLAVDLKAQLGGSSKKRSIHFNKFNAPLFRQAQSIAKPNEITKKWSYTTA